MSPKPAEQSSTAHGPVAARLPLSAAQRDIWMAHGLDATGCRYNIGEYREILGDLDPQLLARAWYQLAREADALRIRGTGADEDGALWQLVRAEPGDRQLELLDLSGESDPAGAARDRMDAELARPFDLADGWLTRHVLIDAGTAPGGERRWFYFHAFHHLAVDGLGIALMDQRLVELYERAAAGEPWGPSPFGTLEELFAEDAGYRTSPEAAADRAHWAGHLAGLPQTPRLGEGRSGVPAPGALPFVRRTVVLPPDRADRLRAVARAHRAPWAMLVIALVAAYVHRVSGSSEPVLGLPVTGRRTELARRTPGMMSNVVPLRVPVAPEGTLAELLAAVVKETRQGLAHQRTRYEDMCRDLGVGESERRITAPLVNIMAFTPGMRFCGFPTTQHNLSNGPVEDLAVGVYDLGPEGGLRIDFDAAPQVCDLAAVAGHQDRFLRFVTKVLDSDLDVPLPELELLGEAERRQVLEEWTGRRTDIGEDTLVDRFEEQVRTRPGARALVFGDEELTYGELDARANRLAHHLAEHGLERGDLAGILLDRGTEFAVALLAVLKTGAGYALLDPEFPDERLAGTAAEAGLRTLVSDGTHRDRVAGPWATVLVDAESGAVGRQPSAPLGVRLTPADTACVMFTSGSTGRPKGILSSHRNLVSTVTAQTYAHFGPGEIFLQCSPVSWDAFSLEFWGALLHGGTTVLQPGQRPEPAAIAALAPSRGVTMLQLSSSLFNFLTDEHPETFATTRIVYTGGEPASPTHVHRLQALHPGLTITNGYGPAESMGFTTTHTIPATAEVTGTVSIGRPLTNKHAYVLDARLHPAPPGTTGELYLAGDGLAHGYLGQPATTAAGFLPNPYGPPGSRLYRTGDQAHWDTEGNLHYTGRTDTQIKIRGFRVEPTEIETVLTGHPRIAQATVVHTTHLTAYVTLVPGAGPGTGPGAGSAAGPSPDPSPAALKSWLRERLPEHMVPAQFAVLDRLPLTPNGKIDKRALPAVELPLTAGGRQPRTELEEIVRTLVSEVLGSPAPLSIDDGFFDHGGHSLLAARLVNRIGSTLGVTLTLRDVFQHPTPAALARQVTAASGRPVLPPLARAAVRPERLPLSFAQQRLWLVSGLQEQGTSYNVPMTVRLDGAVDVAALRAAFGDLVGRHEPLRTRFTAVDGDPRQVVDPAGPAVFEVRTVAPDELDAELLAAARYSFDLAAEHPLRATLLRTGEADYTLLVLMHHIATDGQSLRPLFDDLSAAYAARREHRAPDWAPLPAEYADYALWQRAAQADGGVLEGQLAYWKEALAGLPEELGLVTDRPRPAVAGQRGGAVRVDFGRRLHKRIVELARAERCTPFMVVQAALAALLTRMGAGTDIPLGSPVAGRTDEALSDLVGFFVNTLVLRTDTSGDPAFRELLARVRAADLDAFAHQDAPFDLVLDAVNPTRTLARHPLFQICLALESGPAVAPDLPGLRAGAAEPLATGAVKFDLEFLLRAEPDGPLTGAVLYSSDLYEHGTVERLADMLRRALEHVVAAPDVPVSELELLGEAERRQVLEEWTGRRTDIGEDTLVDRFEAQVRTRPGARALVFGDEELTYGELDARSNRLAHHLAEHGLGRGDLAGILLDRGTEFAVALLAVLKTGAGYALLDPEFPDERLAGTARDAGVGVLVTDARHHARVAGPWTSVLVDSEAEAIGLRPATAPGVRLTPADTACVMFTSGSTGRPKGILSSHRNLVSTVTAQTYAHFGPGEIFLQCSPVSWDAFSLEFWGALLHGGTTVLQPGQRPEPAAIAALSQRHAVTMLQLSSSLFNYLTDEHPDTFSTTRIVYTGGEPASPTHVHRLHALHPSLTITNGYGPAESMGFTTTHTIPVSDRPTPTVSIGRPLTNKQAYVLDARLRPAPPGATGELYLAGDGLAHGYLGQPATTAAAFLPNPYGPPGSRLYRTGDQAHWDAEGNLHYSGRTDTQIKIRGFRVETTEIETVLTSHPDIAQATLATHPDHHNTPQLTAYLVATAPGLSGQDVRLWLRTLLPDHMVPAFVVLLDRLPLTPNGKIDKRALPVPEAAATVGGRAPRTELEATVLAHFADALNTTAPLSIDDGFFDLGGHSLLAARLTNRIGADLGVTLALRDVFQHPTPATLAARIESLRRSAPAAPRRARPALRRRTPDQERSSS
ncbi:amino acid adenylation domain-containing protein [Streptomyces sp. NPDC051546]|uniref:amino acid adenylation domain-containing protein n=1 Tax=Streptomyces sp. NPDC051546 TaxID=3365655 RepID=UPI0037931461